jgi:hypothetical protein
MGSRRHEVLAPDLERRFVEGARLSGEFFMGDSDVHKALEALASRLVQLDIPYAIVGALALNAYGYVRATIDVDVLLTREGLDRFKSTFLGRGYTEKLPGGKSMRDAVHNVDIDVLIAGDYPGDGAEKPVSFPDPAEAAVVGERFSLLPLETLIELKLAAGMTAPHRLRDLADVLELIRVNGLSAELGENLDPYVRDKYLELWTAAQG